MKKTKPKAAPEFTGGGGFAPEFLTAYAEDLRRKVGPQPPAFATAQERRIFELEQALTEHQKAREPITPTMKDVRSAKVVKVIFVEHGIGAGIAGDVYRLVTSIFQLDGTLVAQIDSPPTMEETFATINRPAEGPHR